MKIQNDAYIECLELDLQIQELFDRIYSEQSIQKLLCLLSEAESLVGEINKIATEHNIKSWLMVSNDLTQSIYELLSTARINESYPEAVQYIKTM